MKRKEGEGKRMNDYVCKCVRMKEHDDRNVEQD